MTSIFTALTNLMGMSNFFPSKFLFQGQEWPTA
jgi:hypothetical protein